ncbi:MAG: hypothetical protein NT031_19965 [Planctomycetota bacterium]|nr:hypothetical protein [Planctomycetota bacterium]
MPLNRQTSDSPSPLLNRQSAIGNRRFVLAALLLALAGFASAFTLVWDDDIHWHIAGGQWMLEHHEILRSDPFAVGDAAGRANEWADVHWLFQILVASVFNLAGYAGISVLRASLAAGWMLLFALGLRRRAGGGWLIAAGLLTLAVIAGRLRARPETFTLGFLLATILVVERVREGAPGKWLWLLVPVMLVWANVHVLCVLGLGVLGAALVGAWVESRATGRRQLAGNLLTRPALLASAAVLGACLITPWPGRTFTHAGLLATRLAGALDSGRQSAMSGPELYSIAIDELHPTWDDFRQDPFSHPALAGAILATLLVLAANYRRVRASHVLWLLAFLGLATTARRNIALAGPVCGYLLVVHGGEVLRRLGERKPALNRLAVPGAVAAGVLAVGVAGAYATEWVFRAQKETTQIGAGLQPCVYPVETARFLGALDTDGAVACDDVNDAQAFIQYSWPRRQTWMDGRLEVHSRQRLLDHLKTMFDLSDLRTVDTARIPDAVRFIVVRSKADAQLFAMSHSRRFVLIHLSPDAACFARVDWPAGTALPGEGSVELEKLRRAAVALAGPPLANFDRPLSPVGPHVVGFPHESWHWYRQNPWPYSYNMGQMLLAIGRRPPGWVRPHSDTQRRALVLAVRYLTAALAEDATPLGFRQGLAAKANQELGEELALDAGLAGHGWGQNVLPINVYRAAALNLYSRMDLRDVEDTNVLVFALERGLAMYQAGQENAAEKWLAELLARLPDPDSVAHHRIVKHRERYAALRRQCVALHRSIAAQLDENVHAGAESAPAATDLELLKLADIQLQAGNARDARTTYARIGSGSPQAGQVNVRLALCYWVEGDLSAAESALDAVASADAGDLAVYYRALLAELTGPHPLARRLSPP